MPLTPLTVKLHPETLELYKRLLNEDASETADQFMNTLLENFQNPRKIQVSKQEDQERIQFLEKSLQQLQEEINILRDAEPVSNEADQARIQELEHKVFLVESENAILKNVEPGQKIPENAVILMLNPAMMDLVDICVNKAIVKSKKEFTRVDIFMNLFWEAVSTGRASLPVIFSSSEITQVLKKHKEPGE